MPIGLVSDEEFDAEMRGCRKESSRSSEKESHREITVEIVEKPSRGRDEGDNNVPDSLRQIIGEENLLNGRKAALGLAKDFGISASSVSAYAKGATSTKSYDTPSKSILSHINKSRERAIKKASRTLNAALGSISQDKLDYADAKDLSAIAKDMSVIIKNLEPDKSVETSKDTHAPQFIIYAPQFKKEESFDVIQVSE